MKDEYRVYAEKMRRFNDWEEEYNRRLTPKVKMRQFAVLYRMKESLPPATVEAARREHLESLILSQRRLRAALGDFH